MMRKSTFFDDTFCFLFVFFLIFGMKFGRIDMSVVVPFSIASLYFSSGRLVQFDKKIITISASVLVLLMYQTSIQLFLLTFEFDSALRLIRALLVGILLATVIGSRLFSSQQLLRAIFYSLVLHALLINTAAIFDPLNDLFSVVSGNDRVKPLRASGLLAGFDLAGLLCLLGMLMLLLNVYTPKSSFRAVIYYIVFVLGCFFTSRVSIVFCVIFLSFFLVLNVITSKKNFLSKLLILTIFSYAFFILILTYLIPIIEVTFSLGIFEVEIDSYEDIVSRHAVQAEGSFLWAEMFYLPNGVISTIFGTGTDELYSDVGYVKDIFRYGLIGLLISFATYTYIYKAGVLPFVRTDIKKGNYLLYIKIVFFMIFLLTLKNNYLFTRGLYPFTLLVACLPILYREEARFR